MKKPIQPIKPTKPVKTKETENEISLDIYYGLSLYDILNKLNLSIKDIDSTKLNFRMDTYETLYVKYLPTIKDNPNYNYELAGYNRRLKTYNKRMPQYKIDIVQWRSEQDDKDTVARRKQYKKLKKEFGAEL